ncbi:MAG TPA: FecR family protein, partial [Geobacteraceae bacterium]|nr:FecR family protein [Geobacteraceae bacterium]
MRCFRITLALLVLLLVPLNLFASEQGFARLSLIEGDVQVRIAESDDWVPATPNTPIFEGDSIWSPKGSRAEIQLRDGSVIRLDAKTALNVLKVESDFLQFNLGMGRAYIRTGSRRVWSMQFDLSESTVRVDDKGRYRLDIQEDGDEDISVFRGSAYVESYGSRTRVRTGEMLSLEESRSEISPVNPQDAWDRWNSDRDARQARRSAGGERRLPEELVVYEDELSASGEWVLTREYGQVWRPTAVGSSDWAPYREGRWIWRGGEYVWVSYEPWGWAPYHYGRWAVVSGFGWCWVPPLQGDVFWGPGFVGWITTSSSVGWVPLAPGDIYYGRGHYGRNSVNVTNVTNITINNRTNIYRNSVQRNAVTSVDRNSFITGRGRYVRNSGDIFKKERDRAVAGRPEPRLDSRAIRMPRV